MTWPCFPLAIPSQCLIITPLLGWGFSWCQHFFPLHLPIASLIFIEIGYFYSDSSFPFSVRLTGSDPVFFTDGFPNKLPTICLVSNQRDQRKTYVHKWCIRQCLIKIMIGHNKTHHESDKFSTGTINYLFQSRSSGFPGKKSNQIVHWQCSTVLFCLGSDDSMS